MLSRIIFFKQISLLSQIKLKLKKLVQLHDFNKNSDILISENKDVSAKLKVLFKDKKIHTVTNYYNQTFDNPGEWIDDLPISNFDGFTLLTISANYPHKNLDIIPKVVNYLKQVYPKFKFRFVLTISPESLRTKAIDSIVFLGKVKVNQCPPLYNIADAVFLPTLLECFTATYPEAMRMSTPILTADLNFARGLCGKAAVYFDPLDVASIGDSIYNLSRNQKLIGELIKEGKNQLKKYDSYQDRADKYIEIITN
jgi:glycosyltransferase involved in cell wall biosynthesis